MTGVTLTESNRQQMVQATVEGLLNNKPEWRQEFQALTPEIRKAVGQGVVKLLDMRQQTNQVTAEDEATFGQMGFAGISYNTAREALKRLDIGWFNDSCQALVEMGLAKDKQAAAALVGRLENATGNNGLHSPLRILNWTQQQIYRRDAEERKFFPDETTQRQYMTALNSREESIRQLSGSQQELMSGPVRSLISAKPAPAGKG